MSKPDRADPTPKMHDAIREAAHNLTVHRGCSFGDALRAIVSTYRENLELSLGTRDEEYWRQMLAVAEEELAS